MTAACLLMIAGLVVGREEPDPAALIRQLGSDRFAERVEAVKALEALGLRALPSLKAARESSDPRIRSRVEAQLKSLDRDVVLNRLTQPTLLKLDFVDRPLGQILDEWNGRYRFGLTLQLGPMSSRGRIGFGFEETKKKAAEDKVRSRRIRLESPEPLPFWEAIDRLCQAADLQHDLQPQAGFGLMPRKFLLFNWPGGKPRVSDSGPFRVKVTGLQSTFETDLIAVPVSPQQRQQFPGGMQGDRDLAVAMVVIPEPGRVVRMLGPPTILEATDDQGRNLLPPDRPRTDPEAGVSPSFQPPDLNGPGGFNLSANLKLVDQAGRSIRTLRGSIPVVVVGTAPNPITIPIAGAAGKSVRNDEVTVSILEVVHDDDKGVTIEVEVTSHQPTGPETDPWNHKGPPDFVTLRRNQLTSRIDLLDADGRELALDWNQGHGNDMMTIERRIRLTPTTLYEDQPPDAAGNFQGMKPIHPVPFELRYHGFIQILTEIRFDFRDIPLP